MCPDRGATGQCKTIHEFGCITWLTSWVGDLIAPGEMVAVTLTVVFWGAGCAAVYVQFESDDAAVVACAQSMQGRETHSLTRCRETWWTGHRLFGSFLKPAPRPVTQNAAALICDTDIDWTWD